MHARQEIANELSVAIRSHANLALTHAADGALEYTMRKLHTIYW
jgi:hypothetical protein